MNYLTIKKSKEMKTKNIIASLLAVGVLFAFTACSDDDYTPGTQSPGVYFPVDNPAVYEISAEESSFTVTVARQGITEAATYDLTVSEYNHDIFSVPASVTFEEGATTADLVITYDPTKLVYDEEHSFKLSLGELASQYGSQTVEFVAVRPAPWTDWASVGKCSYQANGAFGSYEDKGLELERRENEISHAQQYRISKWLQYSETDFTELVIDAQVVTAEGDAICRVEPTFTGVVDDTHGEIYVADLYSYAAKVNPAFIGTTPLSKFEDASFYMAQEGKFYLYMVYYCSAGVFACEYDFIQRDGFKDYSIELAYNGVFTEEKTNLYSAVLSATLGADVEDFKVALTGDLSVEETLNGFIDGSVAAQTVTAARADRFFLDVAGAGEYTAVAAVIVDNEVKQYAALDFNVTVASSGDDAEWTNIGETEFISGWIIPIFETSEGASCDPWNFPIICQMQEHKETKGLYRLVDPYHSESYIGTADAPLFPNDARQKGYVVLDATDQDFPFCPVSFAATLDGLAGKDYKTDDIYVSDLAYYYYARGNSKDKIAAAGLANSYDASEDGYTIINPCFGYDEEHFTFGLWGDDGYSIVQSVIYMPLDKKSSKRAYLRAINNRIKSVHLSAPAVKSAIKVAPAKMRRQPVSKLDVKKAVNLNHVRKAIR